MKCQKTLPIALATGLSLSFAAPLLAVPLGENLIVNGNAEAGSCDPVGNAIGTAIPAIPGWTTSGNFSALCYGATGFEFVNMLGQTVRVSGLPDTNSPGPVDRGSNLFFGGGDRSSSSASQSIDLTDIAGIIDAGRATYALDGWLGGYLTDADRSSLILTFRDSGGGSLGVASIVAPTASERNNVTGLFFRSTGGILPIGTRQIDALLDMNYVRGRVNDSYADNLSLVVTAVPEPATVSAVLSIALLAWLSRSRRQDIE